MKHSTLYCPEGKKVFYRCNAEEMPIRNGGAEQLKEYLVWNTRTKYGEVAEQDIDDLKEYLTDIEKKGEEGVPVPYEIMEFYKVPENVFIWARRNKSVVWDNERGEVKGALDNCFVCNESYEMPKANFEVLKGLCAECKNALKELINKNK